MFYSGLSSTEGMSKLLLALFKSSREDAPFHYRASDYSCDDWDGFQDHIWENSLVDFFNLGAADIKIYKGFRLELISLVYISRWKYKGKLFSYLPFLAFCPVSIAQWNHLFSLAPTEWISSIYNQVQNG